MEKTTSNNKIFKIGLKTRILFILAVLGYLCYSLSDYTRVVLTDQHVEMLPMIQPSQSLYLYNRPDGEYQSGDIVFAITAENKPVPHLYRVLAVDGANVKIKGGILWLDNKKLILNGFHLPSNLDKEYDILKKNEYFLIHDNQNTDLNDSIMSGAFNKNEIEILGKLFFYWPKDEKK